MAAGGARARPAARIWGHQATKPGAGPPNRPVLDRHASARRSAEQQPTCDVTVLESDKAAVWQTVGTCTVAVCLTNSQEPACCLAQTRAHFECVEGCVWSESPKAHRLTPKSWFEQAALRPRTSVWSTGLAALPSEKQRPLGLAPNRRTVDCPSKQTSHVPQVHSVDAGARRLDRRTSLVRVAGSVHSAADRFEAADQADASC